MMNSHDYLKHLNIKVTPHKIAMLELFERFRHLDAMQSIKILDKQGINISTATVYRILSEFEQHQIITRHNFGNDQGIYELNRNSEHHDHLICVTCGKVIEFINPQIEELQLQIAAENNFIVSNHYLNIFGTCKDCNSTIK